MARSDGRQWIGRTNAFGYYTMANVSAGQYSFSVSLKKRMTGSELRFIDESSNIVNLLAQ
jgi:hypothetical protein